LEIKIVADNQKKFKMCPEKFLYIYTFCTMKEYLTGSWIVYYTTRFLIVVVHWFMILSIGIRLVLMDYFNFLSQYIMYVLIDCIFPADHISVYKLDLIYLLYYNHKLLLYVLL
jgi:hypothetical protein